MVMMTNGSTPFPNNNNNFIHSHIFIQKRHVCIDSPFVFSAVSASHLAPEFSNQIPNQKVAKFPSSTYHILHVLLVILHGNKYSKSFYFCRGAHHCFTCFQVLRQAYILSTHTFASLKYVRHAVLGPILSHSNISCPGSALLMNRKMNKRLLLMSCKCDSNWR